MNETNNQQQNNQQKNQSHQNTQASNTQTPIVPQVQTPEERNRKMLRTGAIVLIAVIAIALIANGKWTKNRAADTSKVGTAETTVEGCKPGDLFSETSGKPCPKSADMNATNQAVATTNGPGGYEEAIRMYAGKVVVFDAACKPLPAAPTFPIGTRILIANNSATPMTLAVPDRSESLDAYHYFTVPLNTPGTVAVSCNGKVASTLTVK